MQHCIVSLPIELAAGAIADVHKRHDDEDEGEVDGAGEADDQQHLVSAVARVVIPESPRVG